MTRRTLALLTEASHNLERASAALSPEQLRDFAGEAALWALEVAGLTERELGVVKAFIDRRKRDGYDHFCAGERVTELVFDSTRDAREIQHGR